MIRTLTLYFLISRLLTPACSGTGVELNIPKTWDDAIMRELELPLAKSGVTRVHAPADYYYRIPVRPLFKSYPVYHPDNEPDGYFDGLHNLKPELLWDDKGTRPKLESESDLIAAGELVFDAAMIFAAGGRLAPSTATNVFVRDRNWYTQTGAPVSKEGILPFYRYVVREPGKVEVGTLSCALCHTRVMPDGSIIKGAQGNFPFGKAWAYDMREAGVVEPAFRGMLHGLFAVPWLEPDPQASVDALAFDEIAEAIASVPPGVMTRHGTGIWSPVQVPDLIGVKTRRFLDRTGLQRHRGPADLMRYAALNQGLDRATTYNGRLVSGQVQLEPPEQFFEQRYSDEQLYALTMYVYALKPPPNPNLPKTIAERQLVEKGLEIFMASENRCATCHDPKQGFTNNKLVAAPGSEGADNHPERERIMPQRVNTDPGLTLTTRRGTGLYKVPSLLGVWYRGPFEHNGSVASLEDWFDAQRLQDDYVPTGYKPKDVTTRAVKGHEFGLDLSSEDRKALIAYLMTL
jgi:hypothetical protein